MLNKITVVLAVTCSLALYASSAAAQDVRLIGGGLDPTAEAEPVQYEVRPGDTLWDLCDNYYGNPWQWPRIWAQNPQVSNPHYIYPGDVLSFSPLLEEGAPGPEEREATQEDKLSPKGPAVGGARVRFVPREWEHQVFVRYVGFVTAEELRAAGTIRHSREERELLGELDEVYIDFERLPRVRPGDRWTILALNGEIRHPIYNRKVGTKVDILGVVDIRAVTRKIALGTIVRSYKEIKRGALVIPLVPNFRSVKPRPNKIALKGYVVDAFLDTANVGQHQLVYIDKGVREGLEVGNRFHVVRRGDGVDSVDDKELERLPWEPFGEIMVVEARDHHCTGIVLGNYQEILVGDVVEMRVGF